MGMDATHYAPNTAVTREQLVTILARYAAFKGADVSAEADPDFPDVGQVSHYAMSAMAWAVERGLICGIDGMLSPKGTASRAQFATVIMRFCRKNFGRAGLLIREKRDSQAASRYLAIISAGSEMDLRAGARLSFNRIQLGHSVRAAGSIRLTRRLRALERQSLGLPKLGFGFRPFPDRRECGKHRPGVGQGLPRQDLRRTGGLPACRRTAGSQALRSKLRRETWLGAPGGCGAGQ